VSTFGLADPTHLLSSMASAMVIVGALREERYGAAFREAVLAGFEAFGGKYLGMAAHFIGIVDAGYDCEKACGEIATIDSIIGPPKPTGETP
jgi:hypothetical protein